MSTPTTPTSVEPGQIWRDNDQRTKGAGEFVVLAVGVPNEHGVTYAEVRRHATGRQHAIAVDRLLKGTNTQRGYTYLGMQR